MKGEYMKKITFTSILGGFLILFGVYGLCGGIVAKEGWELVLKISLICNILWGLYLIFVYEKN